MLACTRGQVESNVQPRRVVNTWGAIEQEERPFQGRQGAPFPGSWFREGARWFVAAVSYSGYNMNAWVLEKPFIN